MSRCVYLFYVADEEGAKIRILLDTSGLAALAPGLLMFVSLLESVL